MKAKFITFEGIDTSGKSVQARLLHERLQKLGLPVILIRDPGTTKISEQIRRILLDKKNLEMCHQSELLLFSAARAQMVYETILPALEQGKTVICDRFYDSTTAYQGFGRTLDIDMVDTINRLASFGKTPDLTFYIDIEPSIAHGRKLKMGSEKDRMEIENADFSHAVRVGFLEIAKREPERIVVVKGDNPIELISLEIWKQTCTRFEIERLCDKSFVTGGPHE